MNRPSWSVRTAVAAPGVRLGSGRPSIPEANRSEQPKSGVIGEAVSCPHIGLEVQDRPVPGGLTQFPRGHCL
jgi:hypothetical protein